MGGDPRFQPKNVPPPVTRSEPPPPPPAPAGEVVHVDVSGLILRPGDTLILAFERNISDAEAARIQDMVRARLPGINGVAVIEGVAAVAAYRPEATPRLLKDMTAEEIADLGAAWCTARGVDHVPGWRPKTDSAPA